MYTYIYYTLVSFFSWHVNQEQEEFFSDGALIGILKEDITQ